MIRMNTLFTILEIKMTGIIVFQIEILYNDDENLRNNDGLSGPYIMIGFPNAVGEVAKFSNSKHYHIW